MIPKILVVHPGQQHSYRLAIALKRKGILYKYITTVYNKPGSLTSLASCFLKGDMQKKAVARRHADIANKDVKQIGELGGLLEILFRRTAPKWLHKWIAERINIYFEWRVAHYAIKHHVTAVISYDYNSDILFSILKKKAPHITRIMDVSSANRLYRKLIYEKDFILAPQFAKLLKMEQKDIWDTAILKKIYQEIKDSNYFLIPSDIVKKSLQYSGIKDSQMLLCPYGADISLFSCKTFTPIYNRPLRFIYVGGVKELKGIYYLLEAFKRIPKEKATLTVVGAANLKDADLKPYLEHINFTGTVLHSKIPELLQQATVLVFPSLCEGLSLSTLEAAACGLPLIVSENSGVNDLITEGEEGFVIPIQSIEAIIEKVNWFIEHPGKIEPMGRAARKLAEKYTWEAYYERMAYLLTEVLK